MRSGKTWTRRLAASLMVSAVGVLAAVPASSQEGRTVDWERFEAARNWRGNANGTAIDLKIQLPEVLESAFQTLGIESPIPATIADKVVQSRTAGSWTDNFERFVDYGADGRQVVADDVTSTTSIQGQSLGELLTEDGTIGSLVADLAPSLPRAVAKLGERQAGSLAQVKQAGITVGVGEVLAEAAKQEKALKNAPKDIVLSLDGQSRIARLQIVLGDLLDQLPDAARSQIHAGIDTLLGVLYGDEDLPEGVKAGVIPTLQGKLDEAKQILIDAGVDVEKTTGLDLTLPIITREDLLEKPLLSIGLIESTSQVANGTGALKGYQVATATSVVKDVSILADLVSIDVLKSKANVAVNADDARALPPTKQILGLKVGTNRIDLGDPLESLNGIKVNGKGAKDILAETNPALADTIEGLYNTLIHQVVGLGLSSPPVDSKVINKAGNRFASQDVTALLVNVSPLNKPLGLDLSAAKALLPTVSVKFSSASAMITPPGVLGNQIAFTGVPTTMIWFAGALIIGAAILVRRYGFARD